MHIHILWRGVEYDSALQEILETSGHSVANRTAREIVVGEMEHPIPDIIVIDMYRNKGHEGDSILVNTIRSTYGTIPILLATRSDESPEYRKMMLDAGVDGCIQNPFSPEELFLRMKKLVKKKNSLLFQGTEMHVGDVSMNLNTHHVEQGGYDVDLTRTEYSILLHLFLHKNLLVSQDELSVCINERAKQDSSAVNIHICSIRKKIKHMDFLRTVSRYGYIISENEILLEA